MNFQRTHTARMPLILFNLKKYFCVSLRAIEKMSEKIEGKKGDRRLKSFEILNREIYDGGKLFKIMRNP